MISLLEKIKTTDEIIRYLGERCPDLCIYVMDKRGMHQELKDYKMKCRSYLDDSTKYHLYIRGYWLPHLQYLRNKNCKK